MNRADLIQSAARALLHANGYTYEAERVPDDFLSEATAVLDAVLPQITTAEQLEALPVWTVLLATDGGDVRLFRWDSYRLAWMDNRGAKHYESEAVLEEFGPLTVVWRPGDTP